MHFSFQESPIIDFYPIDFKIDLNGKKYAWQGKQFRILYLVFPKIWNQFYSMRLHLTVTWSIVGVALLPFVDEKRLLSTLEKVYPDLTDEEREYKKTPRSIIWETVNWTSCYCLIYM